MSPFSLFSSIPIAERLEAFRVAERHLFDFAQTRFGPPPDEARGRFEFFDTPVAVPSVLRRKKGQAAAPTCQVHAAAADAADGERYSLHGVKVTHDGAGAGAGAGAAPLVLLHGYANGALYFYRNLMGLSRHFGSIYALDMLGWGLSSRPAFDVVPAGKDVDAEDDDGSQGGASGKLSTKAQRKVYAAESFFVESLESWRRHHDLDKMTLAGHSMGGYLSVAYAERYPQHVERLILLSPVGVPEPHPDDDAKFKTFPLHIRAMFTTVRYLFNRGITPGYFLRSLSYARSKAMVEGYIARRLPAITCPEEQRHLGEYLYQNSMLPGSGECCLTDILHANAFAKIPLAHRITALRSEDAGGMEVHMVYGQRDWMDWRGGIAAQRACHARREAWEQRGRPGVAADGGGGPPPRVRVHGVRDAGHLLMLDNYREFNAALIVAAGGREGLPPDAPAPVQFVCDEVAQSTAAGSLRDAGGEEAAADFFRGR